MIPEKTKIFSFFSNNVKALAHFLKSQRNILGSVRQRSKICLASQYCTLGYNLLGQQLFCYAPLFCVQRQLTNSSHVSARIT